MTTPIPQPPGIPLLGNIFDVNPSNTWVSLQKLWEKYGEIFKITVLGQQIVFVGNVALCEELCDQKRFRKFVGGPIVEIRYAVHDSLFTAYENEASWGIAHRILAPYITPDSVHSYFTSIRDCAQELTAKWRKSPGAVSAIGELNRLDLETTTLCFYGRKLNGLEGPEPPMIKGMDGATSEAIKRPTRPKLLNWLFYSGKFKRDTATMRQYASDCLAHRRKNPLKDDDKKDLLWAMMNGKDPDTGKSLTESQVLDEIITMPIGSSTAPCAISSAMYYLAKNPSCITKAREEISSVIGDGDDGEFKLSHVENLPYTLGIVRETFRLSSPAPGFNIEPLPGTTGPVSLGSGKYTIPSKQTCIVVLHGVNRDPSVYPDPEKFDPDRMVGEKFAQLPPGAKKFFGNGKRVCFGENWAWFWCVVTLAVLLKDVDFKMKDESYQLGQDGWFNLRPVGFDVVVKSRGE